MFYIITLITIYLAGFNSSDVKPNYHNLNNLVGEMPEVIVTAIRPTEQEMRSFGVLPEIVVTAEKTQENTRFAFASARRGGILPTVEAFALKTSKDDTSWMGMMPEVIITAERIKPNNGHIVQETKKIEKEG